MRLASGAFSCRQRSTARMLSNSPRSRTRQRKLRGESWYLRWNMDDEVARFLTRYARSSSAKLSLPLPFDLAVMTLRPPLDAGSRTLTMEEGDGGSRLTRVSLYR